MLVDSGDLAAVAFWRKPVSDGIDHFAVTRALSSLDGRCAGRTRLSGKFLDGGQAKLTPVSAKGRLPARLRVLAA